MKHKRHFGKSPDWSPKNLVQKDVKIIVIIFKKRK